MCTSAVITTGTNGRERDAVVAVDAMRERCSAGGAGSGAAGPTLRNGAGDEACGASAQSADESDSDFEGCSPLTREQCDALLYDPTMDDQDAKWVGNLRQGRSSDAILNCPCCFTTLCLDCQQHSKYADQFRAMFVMNCRVDLSATREATGAKRKERPGRVLGGELGARQGAADGTLGRNKRLRQGNQIAGDGIGNGGSTIGIESEKRRLDPVSTDVQQDGMVNRGASGVCHPVFCGVCQTEVAAMDEERVYHFFNVFPSAA